MSTELGESAIQPEGRANWIGQPENTNLLEESLLRLSIFVNQESGLRSGGIFC